MSKEAKPKPKPQAAWIQSHFIRQETPYDGSAIGSLWAYKQCQLQGDSIVSFIGPCDIPSENMVDLEDVLGNDEIYSSLMLHFIVEHFDCDLDLAVYRQRLLVVLAKECLEENYASGVAITRAGDDLFVGERKLSISIATATPVSCKIHLGLNILTDRVPVSAMGLKEMAVEPVDFALELMAEYQHELASVRSARCKVRGVS